MTEHLALRFCEAYQKFCAYQHVVFMREKQDRPRPIGDRILSDGFKQHIAQGIQPIIPELDHLEFSTELRKKLKRLYARIGMPDSRSWTAELLLDALVEIRREIGTELSKHKFVHLRSPNEKYLEQDKLFGNAVYDSFAVARSDLKDAGNCFAVELYTAAVFHLMRVAEHGLRVMAKRLQVTIQDRGQKVPLEYGDWNKVITAIQNKITTSRQAATNARKQTRLDYYSDVLERCSAMKELYRNPVSHTRMRYTEEKALEAMERVRNFMQFLARPIPR